MSAGSATLNFIKSSPVKSVGIPAGITAVALALWPKKENETQNPDGTTQIERSNSAMKNTVITVGTLATLGTALHHWGPKSFGGNWANNIAKQAEQKSAIAFLS